MMDSMTKEELDGIKKINESRMVRIAKGSGARPEEVNFLIQEYKKFQKMIEKMGTMNLAKQGDMKNAMNRNPKQMMEQMQKVMDPRIIQQMGGMGNIMNMVQEMGSVEGMQDMMKKMMGGAGGGVPPGMPPGMMKKKR
mmetsp:Transcript_7292/g.5579  ORF Transcript_7292/g.5579 Transcript_7292/m.5579 type:complete len:138 (+) Transcript_7292:1150-1563(+)